LLVFLTNAELDEIDALDLIDGQQWGDLGEEEGGEEFEGSQEAFHSEL